MELGPTTSVLQVNGPFFHYHALFFHNFRIRRSYRGCESLLIPSYPPYTSVRKLRAYARGTRPQQASTRLVRCHLLEVIPDLAHTFSYQYSYGAFEDINTIGSRENT